jgi:hypothetical protein
MTDALRDKRIQCGRCCRERDTLQVTRCTRDGQGMKPVFPWVATSMVLLTVVQAALGCADVSDTTISPVTHPVRTTFPADYPTPEVVPDTIRTHRVTIEPSVVRFYGTAGLPDGTLLQSELYGDGASLPWWPKDLTITVQAGRWVVSVPITGERFRAGPTYRLDVWQTDNPNTRGRYEFDLVGPPAVRPWWQRTPAFVWGFLDDLVHGRLWRGPTAPRG